MKQRDSVGHIVDDSQSGRKNSVIRAFRLGEDLDRSLWLEAKLQGISVNALTNKILAEHLKYDKTAKQIDWPRLPRGLLTLMVRYLDDDRLIEVGRTYGPEMFKQMLISFCGKADASSFAKFLPSIVDFISTNVAPTSVELRDDGDQQRMIFHNVKTSRLSTFLANMFSSGVEALIGEKPRVEITESSFSLSFRASSNLNPADRPR